MTQALQSTTTGTVRQRGQRDERMGIVVSDKGEKTVRVRHEYLVKHRKYGKYYRRSTILHTHDEKGEARVGDLVAVASCRRISKTKCWRLTRIVRRGAEMVA